MSVFELLNELDQVILRHFGDLEASLATERGRQILRQLLAEEKRAELREWFRPRARPLNSLAAEIKRRLERELGEEL